MAKELFIETAGIRYVKPLSEESGSEGNGKWVADVWRLDEMNLNGRIYSTDLAKRIVAMNLTTMAYDGHDADWRTGNEYKCMVATCSNARIEDGRMVVDVEFYDKEYEARILYLMEKGVPVGVSSVGFGECDSKGKVYPETYEVVRFLDFVTMPAGEVYLKMKNKKDEAEESVKGEPVGKPGESGLSERRKNAADCFVRLMNRR